LTFVQRRFEGLKLYVSFIIYSFIRYSKYTIPLVSQSRLRSLSLTQKFMFHYIKSIVSICWFFENQVKRYSRVYVFEIWQDMQGHYIQCLNHLLATTRVQPWRASYVFYPNNGDSELFIMPLNRIFDQHSLVDQMQIH